MYLTHLIVLIVRPGMHDASASTDVPGGGPGAPRASQILPLVQKDQAPSELISRYVGELAKRVNKVSDTCNDNLVSPMCATCPGFLVQPSRPLI